METGRFPNKLRYFRHCQGYSRKFLARRLGLADASMISRWEKGQTLPTLINAFQLAAMLQTTPQELYSLLWNKVIEETNLSAEEPYRS